MPTQSDERNRQYWTVAGLSLWAAGLVALLSRTHSVYFQPYFGLIKPMAAIALVIVVGAGALYLLYRRGWFMVLKMGIGLRGVTVAAIGATLFGIEVIILDLTVPFPADINVPLPHALPFYPAIAYVVEVVFHALPLAILLTGLSWLPLRMKTASLLWIAMILTALLEPTFQLSFVARPFTWVVGYLWLRLFVFDMVQLMLFRRYDFVTMYVFRLIYYFYWHIAWGTLRLGILY